MPTKTNSAKDLPSHNTNKYNEKTNHRTKDPPRLVSNREASNVYNNYSSSQSGSVASSTHTTSSINDKSSLWKNCCTIPINETSTIQWFEESGHHKNQPHSTAIYARVVGITTTTDNNNNNNNDTTTSPSTNGTECFTIGQVLDHVVDANWKRIAHQILELKKHVSIDSYPAGSVLMQLGAVWLLNETMYREGYGAHAHRLGPMDEKKPLEQDYTLRIHITPERYFAADTVQWDTLCQGLRHETIEVQIAGTKPPITSFSEEIGTVPNGKDGAIVYEDEELGFAILNKPGNVPIHPVLSNHTEDLVSKYTMALRSRGKNLHITLPDHFPEIDTESSGLVCVATKSPFTKYMTHLLKEVDQYKESTNGVSIPHHSKAYKCLVCVKDPSRMGVLEALCKSGKLITHYCDPEHHHFARFLPKEECEGGEVDSCSNSSNNKDKNNHQPKKTKWHPCHLRIMQIGNGRSGVFHGASVNTEYPNSIDACLAHQLWGQQTKVDVQYVMELQVQIVGRFQAHQAPGQLAALGFPVVGDSMKGGGKSAIFHDRHEWKRLAVQCCELSFPRPIVSQDKGGSTVLTAGTEMCVFRLHTAWWSQYLHQFEQYQNAG